MKYCMFLGFLGWLGFVSCKKSEGGTSRILVFNASHSQDSLGATISGVNLTPKLLSQGQVTGTSASPYQKIPAGTHSIVISSGSSPLINKNVFSPVFQSASLLVYDTTATTTSVNALLLIDDLTLPDTTSIRCRFIKCVADTSPADLVLSSKKDTLSLTASFIGQFPTAASFASFTLLFAHGTYKPVVYRSGSRTQVLFSADSVFLDRQRICSFIYSGVPGGSGASALKLGVVFHLNN